MICTIKPMVKFSRAALEDTVGVIEATAAAKFRVI